MPKPSTPIQTTSIDIEVETIIFHNKNNGWSVLSAYLLENNRLITVVGYFHGNLAKSQQYSLTGKWRKHEVYGEQFLSSSLTSLEPQTKPALVRYLASGAFTGIKQKTAEKIVQKLGEKTLSILDQDTDTLLSIPGIGPKTANKIKQSWESVRGTTQTALFLSEKGLSHQKSQKIIAKYGEQTLSILKENPYKLIQDFKGIGFHTADQIALSLGIPANSKLRIKHAILYLLKQAEESGHCFLYPEQIYTECDKLMHSSHGIEINTINDALISLNHNQDIFLIDCDHKKCAVYHNSLYLAEKKLLRVIYSLLQSLFAALPVGAAREKVFPIASNKRTNPETVVLLPTPGPPVIIKTLLVAAQ